MRRQSIDRIGLLEGKYGVHPAPWVGIPVPECGTVHWHCRLCCQARVWDRGALQGLGLTCQWPCVAASEIWRLLWTQDLHPALLDFLLQQAVHDLRVVFSLRPVSRVVQELYVIWRFTWQVCLFATGCLVRWARGCLRGVRICMPLRVLVSGAGERVATLMTMQSGLLQLGRKCW